MVKTKVFLASAVMALLIIPSGGAFAAPASPSSCDALDSLDLATHASNQIDNRISQADPSLGLPIFSSRDFSNDTNLWSFNNDSWTKKGTPLDFSGVAAYRINTSKTSHGLATLVSPKHFISASHYSPSKGDTLGFIAPDGTIVERKVEALQNVPSTDINVGILDADLPDSISYYPIIASSTLQSALYKFYGVNPDVPIVVFDQEAKAIVHKLSSVYDSSIAHNKYFEGDRKAWSEDVVSGDSGNPGFIVIDNQPVLLFAHSSAQGGPNYGNYVSEINLIMESLGGYQLTEYDTSCLTKHTLNYLPIFKNYPQKIIIHTNDTDGPLGSYSASDADVDQTLSFALSTLYNTTKSEPLAPSDYFSINASSGELSLIAPMPQNFVGDDIKLTVEVSDNGENIGKANAETMIDLRPTLDQDAKIILDPDFQRPIASGGFTDLAFEKDGHIVVVGSFTGVNGGTFNGSVRLDANGVPDLSLQNISSFGARSVIIDKDGKAVIGGAFFTKRIMRLNPDGSVDQDFMNNLGNGFTGGRIDRMIDVDGKILATGAFLRQFNGRNTGGITMLNHDGTLDTGFHANFGSFNGFGNASLYDGTDIYVGGTFLTYTRPDSSTTTVGRIIKMSTDGVVDEAFASNTGAGFDGTVRDIAQRSDGKIIIVGDFTKFNETPANHVALLNPDGTLDSEFMARLPDIDNTLFAVLVGEDDKAIIGGNSFKIGEGGFRGGLARLNADGSLDQEFYGALGDGVDGSVARLIKREDGAIAAIGNINSYNGTSLQNSIAIFMPIIEVEEINEPEATPSPSSSSGSGGGGGDSGEVSAEASAVSSSSGGSSSGGGGGSSGGSSAPVGTLASGSFTQKIDPPQAVKFTPKRNMTLGATGEDVRSLQKYLNAKGFIVSISGAGSAGNETTYFGAKTRAALAKFQKSVSISPAVGFFGPITQAYILSH